ncbi:MAG: hypothetical protein AVDCRST_MAG32-1590, partial [uncultured Nocardioides sp.]
ERHRVLVLPDAPRRRGRARLQERRPPRPLRLRGRGLAGPRQGRRAQRGMGQRPRLERRRRRSGRRHRRGDGPL